MQAFSTIPYGRSLEAALVAISEALAQCSTAIHLGSGITVRFHQGEVCLIREPDDVSRLRLQVSFFGNVQVVPVLVEVVVETYPDYPIIAQGRRRFVLEIGK